jgi:hypothetical protein
VRRIQDDQTFTSRRKPHRCLPRDDAAPVVSD